jgi:hypothetical protein
MLYLLIGYMFLFIHRPFEIWPWLGDMHIERVYIILAGAYWLLYPSKTLLLSRLDLGIAGFCAAVLIAFVLSPWGDKGQQVVEDFFKIVVFYGLVTTALNRPEQLKRLTFAFLMIMSLYMLHSLWEYRNGRHTFRMGIQRLIGVDTTLGDPNSFGASIVYALPFVRLFWLTSVNRWIRTFLVGYVGLSAVCIGLTGSRSSLLGLIAWTGIVILQTKHRVRYLALAGLLAAAGFVALPGDLQTRFETMIDPSVGPESARVSGQGRLDGWIKGFALLEKFPLTGCGPGVWRPATGSTIESHSLYGQLMGELGGVGILAFGAFLTLVIMQIVRMRRQSRGIDSPDGRFIFHLTGAIGMAVFLLLLEGLFGHNLLRFNWLWYSGFLVIAAKAMRLARGPVGYATPLPAPAWLAHHLPRPA